MKQSIFKRISKGSPVLILLISLLCSIIFSAAYIVLNHMGYESNTTVYVSVGGMQNNTEDTYTDLLAGMILTNNYREIVKSTLFAEKIIQRLNMQDISPETIVKGILTNKTDNVNILRIAVQQDNKSRAEEIAQVIPELLSEMPESIPGVMITVLDKPSEGKPVLREILLIAAISFITAFLLSFTAMFLLSPGSGIIQTPEDVEIALGMKVTGTIPEYKF